MVTRVTSQVMAEPFAAAPSTPRVHRQWPDEQARVATLVDAARDGDSDAFDELVELTHRDTYTLALRLTGDPHDAADVTQEAYLRAYRSIGSFRSDAKFSTWMYRITANCASTHMGRARRHLHSSLEVDEPLVDLTGNHDPQLQADAGDVRDRLVAALSELPPKLRAVVVLRDSYEMSHEDIADELGISVTAAKVRLHRARRRVRSAVFPDPGDRSADG